QDLYKRVPSFARWSTLTRPALAAPTATAAFARCAAVVAPIAELANHAAAFAIADLLILGPPVAKAVGLLAGALAQQQKVVTGTEPRVIQQLVGAASLATWKAFLHVPDFAHGRGETLGNGGALALLPDELMCSFLHRWDRRQAAPLSFLHARRQGRPEQCGEQERRRYGLALGNTLVGVGQGVANQRAGILRIVLKRLGACREQRSEEVIFQQQLECAQSLAAQEQLENLIEQAR